MKRFNYLTMTVILIFLGWGTTQANEARVFPEEAVLHKRDAMAACDRWTFAMDNDYLVPGSRDQDYTYGLSVSYSNNDLGEQFFSRALAKVDHWLGFRDVTRHNIEFGLYGFTPEDISVATANQYDRPYASLVYGAVRNDRVYPLAGKVIRTQLTIGLLGLNWVGDLQESLHSVVDSKTPRGWRHQISSGGELTLRYNLAQQKLLALQPGELELKQTQSLSLGYITEVSWGLTLRTGQLHSLWHSFNPELASYAETSAQVSNSRSERFLWAGFAIKARAYNVFLQGQLRESAVKYDSTELEHMILEAWLGYTHGFANRVFISYGLRGHTSEVRSGQGNRNVLWGGLMLGRNF